MITEKITFIDKTPILIRCLDFLPVGQVDHVVISHVFNAAVIADPGDLIVRQCFP